jgi:ABC-type uncharacterized transport system permease subunit
VLALRPLEARRLSYPLAAAYLVIAYLISRWTDGVATGIGFFILIAAFIAAWIPIRRTRG